MPQAGLAHRSISATAPTRATHHASVGSAAPAVDEICGSSPQAQTVKPRRNGDWGSRVEAGRARRRLNRLVTRHRLDLVAPGGTDGCLALGRWDRLESCVDPFLAYERAVHWASFGDLERRPRCSSLSGPARFTIRSIRSILHGGVVAVDDCRAHEPVSCRNWTDTCASGHSFARRRAEASSPCMRPATRAGGHKASVRGRRPRLPARRRQARALRPGSLVPACPRGESLYHHRSLPTDARLAVGSARRDNDPPRRRGPPPHTAASLPRVRR